ncbi:MAG TPA: DNA-binding protein HU [Candidatus Competibacteraceae bacterium]|nr:DNA-binding protein HU [Candidatus Competibacteraceae bacterium]
MNKTELIEAVAQATDLSKASAGKAVDAVISAIGKSLKGGDSVVLTGFGTFSIRERPARTGHNPKTGEQMKIEASKVPVFKAGKTLRDGIK